MQNIPSEIIVVLVTARVMYASAGVPVISSRWPHFSDIVDDGVTGYGFELGNKKDLVELLTVLCNNHDKINSLKQNCLVKAAEFSALKAVERLKKLLS